MKKIILLLLTTFSLLSFYHIPKKFNSGKLTQLQLNFVKTNYNWNDEAILIVNFTKPQTNCFHEYSVNSDNIKWWKKFYSRINLENCLNVFVFSENKINKKFIDSEIYYMDKYKFFNTNFFSYNDDCLGLLVINRFGYFEVIDGEYSEYEVTELIKKLKNQ